MSLRRATTAQLAATHADSETTRLHAAAETLKLAHKQAQKAADNAFRAGKLTPELAWEAQWSRGVLMRAHDAWYRALRGTEDEPTPCPQHRGAFLRDCPDCAADRQ